MRIRNCLNCNKEFTRKYVTNIAWETGNKFCSRQCGYDYTKKTGIRKGENNPLWQGGKLDKVCTICQKKFQVWKSQSSAHLCSKECVTKYRQTPEYRNNISEKHKGKIISEEQRKKISATQKGKRLGAENATWKGDNVGYRSLHEWVIRLKGTPNICEHCGLDSKVEKKRLVWANKSHEYKRDLEDWMRLCYVCHRKYDFPNEKHPR